MATLRDASSANATTVTELTGKRVNNMVALIKDPNLIAVMKVKTFDYSSREKAFKLLEVLETTTVARWSSLRIQD